MTEAKAYDGPETYCLYRWYDDEGILIYVGVTHDIAKRTKWHLYGSSWAKELGAVVDVDPDVRDVAKWIARAAELRAIHDEAPVFNWQDNEHVRERVTWYWERRGIPPERQYGGAAPCWQFPSPIGPMRAPACRDRPILDSERVVKPRRGTPWPKDRPGWSIRAIYPPGPYPRQARRSMRDVI